MLAVELVGRETEQQTLELAISRLRGGTGGVCLVSGDAGSGKTTLVESVLSRADVRVLRGGSASGGLPYAPLRAALHDYLRRSALEKPERSMISSLSQVMAELGEAMAETGREIVPDAIRHTFE
ncbi:MAG: ATP-binding protein, partial [Actinomycetota bacterium]